MATTRRKSGSAVKPTRVKNRAGTFFAKRTRTGKFRAMDQQGRSLRSDRRTKAKTTTKSGYGDRGDRRR